MTTSPALPSKREQTLANLLRADTIDPLYPAKPPRNKNGTLDGRYLQRTGRREQLNFKVTLEVATEIRQLMLRDELPSLAVWLEEALLAYRTMHRPAQNEIKPQSN